MFPASLKGPWAHLVEEPNSEGIGTATYRHRVPADEAALTALAKRPLTALSNELPTWLQDLQAALDGAVFEAYGLARDASDQRILDHLLTLSLWRTDHS